MNIQPPRANQDLEAHWMPFTANRDFKARPRLVTRSEGMYLWNQDGGRLIDGSSGLFNVAAGHGRREIADAVHAQMLANDYTAPFQLGHPAPSRSPTAWPGCCPTPSTTSSSPTPAPRRSTPR